jgi:mono/diheme cytochrome c family protein
MKGSIILILLLGLITLVIVGCSTATPEPTPVPTVHPGQSIVNNRCTGCHDLNRVTGYKADEKMWALTVDRMVLLGAALSEPQRDLVVDYLATNYPKE